MKTIHYILLPLLFLLACNQPPARQMALPVMAWFNSELDGNATFVLNNLQNAGFNLAALPFESLRKNQEWLNIADSTGIRLILSDHRIDRYIHGPGNGYTILDSMIADYSHHPSFAGYFIYDKPDSQILHKLSAGIRYLDEHDSQHPSIINIFPVLTENKSFYYELWQIMDNVQPRLVCFEQYPENEDNDGYYANLESLRSVCSARNVPFWVTIISTQHHQNKAAEKSQLDMQVFSALAYGASGLSFYSSSVSDEKVPGNGTVNNAHSERKYIDYIYDLNRYIEEISPIQEKLSSTGVYHTKPVPAGCTALTLRLPVTLISKEHFLLGCLQNGDDEYIWLVNKNTDYGSAPVVTFEPGVTRVIDVMDDERPVVFGDNSGREHHVKLIFKAGEGRLFKLEREL